MTLSRLRGVLLASMAVAALIGSAGCSSVPTGPTGSSTASGGKFPRDEARTPRDIETAGADYRAQPGNPDAALRYAEALHRIGEDVQASAVLEQASMRNPTNKALLGAYGLALADTGQYGQAFEVLRQAHTPDQPDWRLLSAQGAVLDQMAKHEEARRYYASALKIAPDEPSVLSNLGLSYALSKDLTQAEATLKRAVSQPGASPRVRQNLALVVGLAGRYAEAEAIARADLPADQAAENIEYLRRMLASKDHKVVGSGTVPSVARGS